MSLDTTGYVAYQYDHAQAHQNARSSAANTTSTLHQRHHPSHNIDPTGSFASPKIPHNTAPQAPRQPQHPGVIPSRQSPEFYASSKVPHQPYQYYQSEWVESPNLSPAKLPQYYEEMTTIQLQQQKYDTPLKLKTFSYITPVSAHKVNDVMVNEKHLDDETSSTSSEEPPTVSTEAVATTVGAWDVFWVMLNDITGKDKLAKVGQYVLKLLLLKAEQSQSYLSDSTININAINLRYNDKEKRLNLIRNFIKHPQDFIRVISILVCSIFQSKLAGMVNGLSTYRQYLRFGKSPFRLRGLLNKLRTNINFKNANVKINYTKIFNRTTLGEFFGLYYSIFDETNLLLKLNFYSDPRIKQISARHEALAWYYDTWLNLYNAYEKSQDLTQQEMDVKIQIQVKNKAKVLSRQLLGGNPIQINNKSTSKASKEDAKLLNDIQFKKNNAYLDIYKNISDLIFNSYTVFNLRLPFDTIQIWMGISAASLSTIKIYRETKKKLIEDEIKKRK
ncbi:uncharacterized protein CANTADRAFT_55962 [Suhomyces tanzawaensis NRRL Y-17324]|uniref:Peroxisomal membrane protein PEX25 n=1 Tax=Suhomyces tanzawaensis NRRL Y-17324 TaxID=984487 RepID=A0A1E4SCT0_9ASCO|nr:uncharacterized protein CANTADRAFT_55962 [Suhomyces tanzawaensis NRRL Y-17324]ODV77305.1 hypothetical protein CANTADRAFT_55962 [Suhomyces tanzawaensis NRRL Y-17324]